MTPLLLLSLLSTSSAADLSGVRPRRLGDEATVSVTGTGGRIALATESGGVWVGSGRMTQVGTLDSAADGLHLSGGAVTAWSTRREGLCVESRLAMWAANGTLRTDVTHPTAPVAVAAVPGHHAVLWPARLDLVPVDGTDTRRIPLPWGQPMGLSFLDGLLQVDGAAAPLMAVDIETGCTVGLKDDPDASPLVRYRSREAQRVCGAPPRLPVPVLAAAEVAQSALMEMAVRAGDTEELARLGAPSCAALEQMRPTPASASSAFTVRFEQKLKIEGRLIPSAGLLVVIRNVDAAVDLDPWLDGDFAPACEAQLVLEGTSPAVSTWLKQRVHEARAAGATCAENVLVAWPGEVGPFDDEDPGDALYALSDRQWIGFRAGAVSARMVRFDLARLDQTDPLHDLAKAPELSASWSIALGPGGPIIADVDGSWVAGVGWDLVRGPPNAIRRERAALIGPVQRLQGRKDGRFEVVVGGYTARVALEGPEVEWTDARAPGNELLKVPNPLPPRPDVDHGPWRIVGDGKIGARSEKGPITVDMLLPIERLVNGRVSSYVVTPLGMFGVGADGTFLWRLTEVDRWIFTDAFVVGTSQWGVHGYRPPL